MLILYKTVKRLVVVVKKVDKGPRPITHKNRKKCTYRPCLLQLIVATARIFITVFYMDNHFHNDFFKKSLCENRCSAQGRDKQR